MDEKLSKLLHQFCQLLNQNKKRVQEHYHWDAQARQNQKEPQDPWRVWLILAGRGFGKTRTGAETIRQWIDSGKYKRIALIGETEHDTNHVMVNGESGLLNVYPLEKQPKFIPSQRQIQWENGAVATLFSGDYPDQLRGPQFDAAWIDELTKFKRPQYLWDMLNMALRLGRNPKAIITTTPRPIPLMKAFLEEEKCKNGTVVTRGTTFDNKKNLASGFIQAIQDTYGTTGLARQELYGELLPENSNGLWSFSCLDSHRIKHVPPLEKIVVAVDPAITHTAKSDETGIIVVGRCAQGKGYVLEDGSGKMAPFDWAKKVCALYEKHCADRVVVEVNQGGDLVRSLIQQLNPALPITEVRATRGKITRAEPIAALYERGLVFHLHAGLEKLEAQMTTMGQCQSYVHSKSPDRVDALVWGLTYLFNKQSMPKVWRI